MNFKGVHIEGKYAVFVALIGGISVLGASVIQVYKPFVKPTDTLEIIENKNGLYSAKYIIKENLETTIFEGKKKENFSINPTGKKLVSLEKVPSQYNHELKNLVKVMNYDTSFSNEITLYSYANTGNQDHPERMECQLKIKGWSDPNSIILNIDHCLDSFAFTIGGYTIKEYPNIKTKSNYFNIKSAGDYSILFDEFNVVKNIEKIR